MSNFEAVCTCKRAPAYEREDAELLGNLVVWFDDMSYITFVCSWEIGINIYINRRFWLVVFPSKQKAKNFKCYLYEKKKMPV